MTNPPMPQRKSPSFQLELPGAVTWYADLNFRDQRELMERPFFSLSKTPRFEPIEYQFGYVYVKVLAGNETGIATIWDADVLIWAATQIIALRNAGQPFSRTLTFHPRALLQSIGRGVGQKDYRYLEDAFRRLHETVVVTNIRAQKRYRTTNFHWIDDWEKLSREPYGISSGATITLSRWIYRGIVQHGGVLAINKDYFLLTGGLERWLYRIARKHGGNQPQGWSLTLSQLYLKSGSRDRPSNFRLKIRRIVQANPLPDYHLSLVTPIGGDETLTISPRLPSSIDAPTPFEFP